MISIRRPSIFHCWPCFNSAAGRFFLAALRIELEGRLGLLERCFIAAFNTNQVSTSSKDKLEFHPPNLHAARSQRTPSQLVARQLRCSGGNHRAGRLTGGRKRYG